MDKAVWEESSDLFNFNITENRYFLSACYDLSTKTELDKICCLLPSGDFPSCFERFTCRNSLTF